MPYADRNGKVPEPLLAIGKAIWNPAVVAVTEVVFNIKFVGKLQAELRAEVMVRIFGIVSPRRIVVKFIVVELGGNGLFHLILDGIVPVEFWRNRESPAVDSGSVGRGERAIITERG